ncbi:MAG: Clp1/GlmU family protein [Desulfobaccales bacterium]
MSAGEPFPFLASLDLPPGWVEAGDRFVASGGTAMILGGTDSGKSTLSRYLVYRAYAAGEPVGLMDLDLGQSHVGPPAALGLAAFPPHVPGDDPLFPEELYFIGQTSPVAAVLEVVVGARVLADAAAARGLTRLVVNTSGLVSGGAAVRLKRGQVELLRPALLLALARGEELAPLVRAVGEAAPLLRLAVSPRAMGKSPEMRRAYREERFRDYFRAARELRFPWGSVQLRGRFFGEGRRLSRRERQEWAGRLGVPVLLGEVSALRHLLLVGEAPEPSATREFPLLHLVAWSSLEYCLAGLLDGGHRTLAVGIVLPHPWEERLWRILTPLAPERAGEVRYLNLGRLRLTPEGRELGPAACP